VRTSPHIDEEQGCTLQRVRTAACKGRVISLTLSVIGGGFGSRCQDKNDEQEKREIENDLLSLVKTAGGKGEIGLLTFFIVGDGRYEQPKNDNEQTGREEQR